MTKTLLERYNELAPRKLKSWKGKKDDLARKVELLENAAKPAPAAPASKKKGGIGAACFALLGNIKYHEDEAGKRSATAGPGTHPVGTAYSDILVKIKKIYPESKVDRNHLRWYANKMRELDQPIPVYREKSTWEEEAA